MPTYKELIDATDIVSLISKYVNLQKQGTNYTGLCPFHHENTPSFIVSPEKKIFKCFGCGQGGDALSFIEKIENIPYKEALKKLAAFNGITLDNDIKKEDENTKYYDALDTAIDYFHKNLLYTDNGDEALKYLNDRGLDKDIIKIFSIGLSPDIGSKLHDSLLEINISDSTMESVGLTSLKNGKYFDYFTNRIMFPIYDDNNKPVGFSARIFHGEKNEPKYINTKDTKLFQKNSVWFNLNRVKPEILKRHRVIIHEGQMDVIASYRAGLKEAICSMGTALNPNQVNLLKKYTNNVILCYDSDSAGINAAKKSQEIFKMAGFNVHFVFLEGSKVPDEYVS
jgi:DNA primase